MISGAELAEALAAAYPELAGAATVVPDPVYLVGGAVRDLLLGRGRADIDLVVEGDPGDLAVALDAEIVESHPRFGTLKVELAGHEVDIAAARRERYVCPGALPTVELGAPIRADLARRDFTVNAMAVPLAEPGELIDPYAGQADLEAGVLRVIHRASFVDDPTRAIRAARYAARFGFEIEPGTRELLRATDLTTVTPERRGAELRKLAAEATAVRGLELLADWGLIRPRPGGAPDEVPRARPSAGASAAGGPRPFALARAVDRLMSAPPWSAEADRAETILAAALGPIRPTGPDAGGAAAGTAAGPPTNPADAGAAAVVGVTWRPPPRLAEARPSRPSEGVRLARGRDPIELVLARAAGAEWLDDWLVWRDVRLDITGTDLTAAGLTGPAVGRALEAALAAKLDGDAKTRADELRIALAAGRPSR